MSKRAKSAERKYYGALYSGQMKNEREGFIKGYEQAEKDTIERAWEWMTIAKGKHTFEDFRKAMEEE